MNTSDSPSARRVSAWLMSAATLLVATAITAWAPAAQAQGKALQSSGAAICDFDGFTYNAATNTLTINCTGTTAPPPPPPPPGPGTFSLSPSVSVAPNGTTTVNIVRTGGSLGSYTVGYTMTPTTLTGWSVNNYAGPHAAVWFNDGQTVAPLVVAAGSTTGSLVLTLVGNFPNEGTTATTTAVGSATVTVTPGATGGNPAPTPPPPPGCTTNVNYTETFSFNGQKQVFDLKPGETAAMIFRTKDVSDIEVSTTETVNTPINADHQVSVSTCPGDFSKTSPCMYTANLTGQTMFTTTQPLAWWAAGSKCKLDPNTTYYMNIRQVKRDNVTVNSCTQFSCQIRVQVQNF